MNLIPVEKIQRCIYFIRDQKVMLDRDLALLYGVTTGNLNLAVHRNSRRFPADFMFQLTEEETKNLILQTARSSGWGGLRHRPYVFTEHGVSMLSSVLRSERAILVNITIMRAFGQIGRMLETHREMARKLDELEKKYDSQFKVVFDAIRRLMRPTAKSVPRHVPRVKGFTP
jgi:hypothetical protein